MGVVHLLVLFCTLVCPTCATAESTCSVKDCDEPDALSLLSYKHSLSSGLSGLQSFASFMVDHGRTYRKGTAEFDMRRATYDQGLEKIRLQNNNPHRKWNAAVNHLADRTDVELAELRGLRAMARSGGEVAGNSLGQTSNVIVPKEKSWAHLKAAKADTNQLSCGSCWAVASATVLSANAEIHGYDHAFSPQELVSCTPNPHKCGGDGGCKGSTVELAMEWALEKGLASEEDTPYEGRDTHCKKKRRTALLSHDDDHDDEGLFEDRIAVGFHPPKSQSSPGVALGMIGWERLPENKYEPLMLAVTQRGPVGISVAANAWHLYGDGVFDGCKRDAVINHAVTLIGFGKDEDDTLFWHVKNSWGLHWGEKGNIRLLRHEGNKYCGTDHQPKVGTACKGGPATVPVCGMCGILYDSVVPHFRKRA